MAFVNLPPNLQDIFYSITDRVSKLESGPNQAMSYAVTAQATSAQGLSEAAAAYAVGIQAQAQATQALIQAQASYALSSQSLIKSANTITNASNQITGINGNGITVYSGASANSGARVVLNSAGIAGYNSANTATFAIDSANGNVSITGALFTGGTISGGSLNIAGNCTINSSGLLTAYNATIQGNITSGNATITGGSLTVGPNFQVNSSGVLTASNAFINGNITATSGTFTGTINAASGTIGGWTIGSTFLQSGTSSMSSSTGNAAFNNITAFGTLSATGVTQLSSTLYVGSTLTVNSSATFGTSLQFRFFSSTGNLGVDGTYSNSVSGRTMLVSSGGIYGTSASTERKKQNILPYKINANALLQLEPMSFNYIESVDEEQNPEYGFIAEDADRLGLFELVGYDKEGLPDYFAYEKLPVFLLQVIKDQEARIKILEGK
jgi:hypothetical protein